MWTIIGAKPYSEQATPDIFGPIHHEASLPHGDLFVEFFFISFFATPFGIFRVSAQNFFFPSMISSHSKESAFCDSFEEVPNNLSIILGELRRRILVGGF